ncbi:MAG: DUF1232 domain-containing protein [Oscillatoriales cyanobacterium RM1_1_9]|nr:DUF1232 domain-containing protein [Oscillatoriales cyanobacterium SM2_3_0]NJO47274.1 DUF1232 domain-containing protein [Oscillatoriales cyanobacterium RM2_1_1]NJO70597.1 DUF1232 domain-containing protein [Oscillatoriales cyanobacterium RM1_1_9]
MQAFYRWYQLLLRNPKYRWWIILGTIFYLFSPLDISPDLLPIIGQIDDVILVTLLFSGLYEMVGDYMRSLTGQGASDSVIPDEDPNPKTSSNPGEVIDVDARTIE